MRRILGSGATVGVLLCGMLILQGCANQEGRDARLVYEQPKCSSGEVLQCEASSTGRISDGRFGRRSRESQLCHCEQSSAIDDVVRGLPPMAQ